jgi:hypothetical protein
VLTVDAPAGLSLVLDFLVLVALDVSLREDVAELARVKRARPVRRIFVLELESFVEHRPYASRAYWAALDVDAGVVVEILATALAVPAWSHLDVNEGLQAAEFLIALRLVTISIFRRKVSQAIECSHYGQ